MQVTPKFLDTDRIRQDFPILSRTVHGDKKLVYLDNAATSQKPRQVIDAISEYYSLHNANVHRGIHALAEEATALYEGARDKIAAFINAPREEVVFTKNSSEALNLVANVLGWAADPYGIGPGDEIVVTEMEHHSNIVPWQMTAERTGAKLRWFGITDEGRLDVSNIDRAHQRADQGRLVRPRLQPAGHRQPDRDDRGAGARGRRADRGRRLAVRAAHAAGRQRPRRRLRGLHRPQDARPDRHRRAVGPPRPAGGAAAVPGRRRDDRDGLDGALDLRGAAAQVRGRHADDRGGRRAWRRRWTT